MTLETVELFMLQVVEKDGFEFLNKDSIMVNVGVDFCFLLLLLLLLLLLVVVVAVVG
jgi:hypothetical protein